MSLLYSRIGPKAEGQGIKSGAPLIDPRKVSSMPQSILNGQHESFSVEDFIANEDLTKTLDQPRQLGDDVLYGDVL